MTLLFIILATLTNGLMALIGGLTLTVSKGKLDLIIKSLVALSAGTMFAGSIFHLLVEAEESMGLLPALYILTIGFLAFFVLERYLWYHHCHEGECDVHPVSYLVLFGDAIHNLLDGILIAAAFISDWRIGLVTTAIVLIHEIPQELGDFGVLVDSGFEPKKALFYNFLSQLTAVFGGVTSYFALTMLDISKFFVPLAAGGFLYISASDLIPEIHRHSEKGKALFYFFLFVAGISIMIALKFIGE